MPLPEDPLQGRLGRVIIPTVYSTGSVAVQASGGLRPLPAGGTLQGPDLRADPAALAPSDRVTLSVEAQATAPSTTNFGPTATAPGSGAGGSAAEPALGTARRLTPEEAEQVAELQERDEQVRASEAAKEAAGGAAAQGVTFTYKLGPDGREYAVAGQVAIRIQQGATPDETIADAEAAENAALASPNPSLQDLEADQEAVSLEADARAQKAKDAAQAYARARALQSETASGQLSPDADSPPTLASQSPAAAGAGAGS